MPHWKKQHIPRHPQQSKFKPVKCKRNCSEWLAGNLLKIKLAHTLFSLLLYLSCCLECRCGGRGSSRHPGPWKDLRKTSQTQQSNNVEVIDKTSFVQSTNFWALYRMYQALGWALWDRCTSERVRQRSLPSGGLQCKRRRQWQWMV